MLLGRGKKRILGETAEEVSVEKALAIVKESPIPCNLRQVLKQNHVIYLSYTLQSL